MYSQLGSQGDDDAERVFGTHFRLWWNGELSFSVCKPSAGTDLPDRFSSASPRVHLNRITILRSPCLKKEE